MPNIYITDETKDLIERVCKLDKRTQDGEINFLLSERFKELSAPSGSKTPSVGNEPNKQYHENRDCQEKSKAINRKGLPAMNIENEQEMRTVQSINMSNNKYPDAVSAANDIAKKLRRRPHDAVQILLVACNEHLDEVVKLCRDKGSCI